MQWVTCSLTCKEIILKANHNIKKNEKKSNAQQVFFLMTHKINLYSDYIKIISANLC